MNQSRDDGRNDLLAAAFDGHPGYGISSIQRRLFCVAGVEVEEVEG